jgi:hypothetical protein
MSKKTLVMLVGAIAGTVKCADLHAQSNSRFDLGNFVIVRAGDGSTTLSSNAARVDLVEFGLSGTTYTAYDTVTLPSATTGGNNLGNVTLSGSATSDGGVSLSSNGAFITLGGYDAQLGSASVSGTTSTTANRVVATVAVSNLAVSVNPKLTDSSFSGDNFRSVASDGTRFYLSGNASATANRGVRYAATSSATASTQIINANTRQVRLVNGRAVYASASGISYSSSASPTTADAAPIALTLSAAVSDTGQFVFFDRSSTVGVSDLGGVDTLYVVDGSAVRKYEYSGTGTNWTSRGSFTTAASAFGLAGAVTTSGVQLVAVAKTASDNAIYALLDSVAFGGTVSGSMTSVATAGANFTFKGVEYVPEPGTLSLLALGTLPILRRRQRTRA